MEDNQLAGQRLTCGERMVRGGCRARALRAALRVRAPEGPQVPVLANERASASRDISSLAHRLAHNILQVPGRLAECMHSLARLCMSATA